VAHRLELSFSLASEVEVKKILDHWQTCQGTFLPFYLAAETWCGTEQAFDLSWRFAEAPQTVGVAFGWFGIGVKLVSVTYSLAERSLAPIAAGTSAAIVAETAPAVTVEPGGTFFRADNQSLQVASGATFRQSSYVFPFATATIAVLSDAVISASTSNVIQAECGSIEFRSIEVGLTWNQNLPPVVIFGDSPAWHITLDSPEHVEIPQPQTSHIVRGAFKSFVIGSLGSIAGTTEPIFEQVNQPVTQHTIKGESLLARLGSMAISVTGSTPEFSAVQQPAVEHGVIGGHVLAGLGSMTITVTDGTPEFESQTP
jgi:hypothetical protein